MASAESFKRVLPKPLEPKGQEPETQQPAGKSRATKAAKPKFGAGPEDCGNINTTEQVSRWRWYTHGTCINTRSCSEQAGFYTHDMAFNLK